MAEESDLRRRTREVIKRTVDARNRSDAARKRAEQLAMRSEELLSSLSLIQTRQKDRIQKRGLGAAIYKKERSPGKNFDA